MAAHIDPREAALWATQRPVAQEALLFWNAFFGLSRAERRDQPLANAELERLLAILRAVSWAVSEHGGGAAPTAAIDPLGCGEPGRFWWRQLVSPTDGAQEPITCGFGRRNYRVGELPSAALATRGFPAGAALTALANPADGHSGAGFTPVMSYVWGAACLIHTINTRAGRPTYVCADLSAASLLAGATAFVGPESVDLSVRLRGVFDSAAPAEVTTRGRALDALTLGASIPNVTNPKVPDVARALASLPKDSASLAFSGEVKDKGGVFTHLQGVAVYKDVYVLTQSDQFENAGRLLVADRATRSLLREVPLPIVSASPRYFHAGGCQLIGDLLVVPSETQDNASVVAFFDVSDPANIVEFDESLRVFDDQRDAAAAGVTNVTHDGQEIWVLAVYDSGTVTIYSTPDLPGRAPFTKRFAKKVSEKNHQALPLVTDTANRVFAVGINRGNLLSDDIVTLYLVDLVAGAITPFPDEKKAEFKFSTPGDPSLRWGSCIDISTGSDLVMHCTSKFYRKGCKIGVFDNSSAAPSPVTSLAARAPRTGRRPLRKRAPAKKKTSARRRPTSPRKR